MLKSEDDTVFLIGTLIGEVPEISVDSILF